MSIFDSILGPKPFSAESEGEVNSLVRELINIGIKEDYLSESPGNGFNAQCRHIRTRQIGQRLDAIGGNELMKWVYKKVKKGAGKTPADHLEYAWSEIGQWQL
jgi:hypothetical protein